MTADPPRDDTRPDPEHPDEAEEALNWDTSIQDASYVEGPKPVVEKPAAAKPARRARAVVEPGGGASTGSATEATEATEADEATEATEPNAPVSSILLVTYGIIAGAFVLYAVGWFTSVRRNTYVDPSVLGAAMTWLGGALAIAAAPLWFAGVFALTRESKPLSRLLWLLLGLVLLAPIPFFLGV
jgi:hypothetical protein